MKTRLLLLCKHCIGIGEYFQSYSCRSGPALGLRLPLAHATWVVVKIMVPFWIPIIIRPLKFRVP